MAITRRQFLELASGAAAGSLLGPGVFGSPFVRRALAETIGDRYLVVLFLDGGNDGLNTVVPVDNAGGLRALYDVARPSLGLAPDALAMTLLGSDPGTGEQLAFHPGLRGFGPGTPGFGGLKSLYDLGKVAVIQGCGYPEHDLSHEISRVAWQTGDPLGSGSGAGWVARHLALEYAGSAIPAVNIADAIVGEFRQSGTGVLTLRSLADFDFPYDPTHAGDDVRRRDAFLALHAAASGSTQPFLRAVADTGTATLLSSEKYPLVAQAYDADPDRAVFADLYEGVGRDLARSLREVSKVIYGVSNGLYPGTVAARFFQVNNNGYDTHADQGGAEPTGQHFTLHAEVGAALKIFYDDLDDMGVADKVCVLVWSEFGRRIPQNDNGTDHGSQGPMFVIGGAVNGGLYGNHPNISPLALDGEGNTVYSQDANAFRSTDFRDVYGTVFKHWLNMPAAAITGVGGILPPDGGDPASYWTAPDLDLAFLP
ncbi:MAG: DUF1501 domain-containing protein [Deltaproteobacteria bacterium]|nr:DUF1501 domain-containing protein [Deltaproteobacteria bacterium]